MTLPTGIRLPVMTRSSLFLFQEVFLQPGYLELLATLPAPKTVCDIGVNHGYFSLACEHSKRLRHIDSVTFYAGIDANPFCVRACQKNYELNLPPGSFVTELGCIGQPGTTVDFYVDKNDLNSSALQKTTNSKCYRIPALDLDAFFKKYFPGGCDLMKVDVQGAEGLLLQYWSETISKNCRAVILEYHPYCGIARADFKAHFVKLGFTATHFPNEAGEFLALFVKT
jgi:FkbM family methyltransferase